MGDSEHGGAMTARGADTVCACGHPKDEHAGRTKTGICYPCYGASDHGPPGTYCGRFRRPTQETTPRIYGGRAPDAADADMLAAQCDASADDYNWPAAAAEPECEDDWHYSLTEPEQYCPTCGDRAY